MGKRIVIALGGNALGNELRVRVGLSHFGDIDADGLALGDLGELLFDDFDLGACLSDEHAGTARVDRNDDPARRALDEDARHGGGVVLLL